MAATRPGRPRPVRPDALEGRLRSQVGREVGGAVRAGRSTKLLVRRLQRGEIALIDHLDLDRVCAEELIAAGTLAVLNCRASSGGSYPNLGPQLLVEAGVLLVDLPGDDLFGRVTDGQRLELRVLAPAEGVRAVEVVGGGEVLARGELLDSDRVSAVTEARRRDIDDAIERFARNTIEHMREERELLAGRIQMPRFATDLRDRPTLVVARGVGHQRDLRALRPFIRDTRPVIIAVDGAADALLEEGLTPDMIVGDMDSAGERALRCGAELVVHSYPNGHAPGSTRLRALGLRFKLVAAPGMSEDVALLIAAEKGARLIVSVGSQFNLVEFLDRNRKGMSSTLLTRLRVGEILVDAKGVSRLSDANGHLGRLESELRRQEALASDLCALAVHERLLDRRIGLLLLGACGERVEALVGEAVAAAGGSLTTVVSAAEGVGSPFEGALTGLDGVVVARAEPPETGSAEGEADRVIADLAAGGVPAVGVALADAGARHAGWYGDRGLSSVEALDSPAGRTALVYALAGWRGSFGPGPGAHSLLPGVAPRERPDARVRRRG